MEVFSTPRFEKRFEALPSSVQKRIQDAIEKIAQNPYQGKKLSGPLEGDYSWRVGEYRILYTIVQQRVYLESVAHRKEVYR